MARLSHWIASLPLQAACCCFTGRLPALSWTLRMEPPPLADAQPSSWQGPLGVSGLRWWPAISPLPGRKPSPSSGWVTMAVWWRHGHRSLLSICKPPPPPPPRLFHSAAPTRSSPAAGTVRFSEDIWLCSEGGGGGGAMTVHSSLSMPTQPPYAQLQAHVCSTPYLVPPLLLIDEIPIMVSIHTMATPADLGFFFFGGGGGGRGADILSLIVLDRTLRIPTVMTRMTTLLFDW